MPVTELPFAALQDPFLGAAHCRHGFIVRLESSSHDAGACGNAHNPDLSGPPPDTVVVMVRGARQFCTNCGWTECRIIAPNYVECQGFTEHSVLIGEQQVGWAPPGRPVFGPVYGTQQIPCRVRRHQSEMMGSVNWPSCLCGTFAIGQCFLCREPVCGDDSSRVEPGVRVCGECTRLVGGDVLRIVLDLAKQTSQEDRDTRRSEALQPAREERERVAAGSEMERQRRVAEAAEARAARAAQSEGREREYERRLAMWEADPDPHGRIVAENEAAVGSFEAHMARMRKVRDDGNREDFLAMLAQLGCGWEGCAEPGCVSFRNRVGVP